MAGESAGSKLAKAQELGVPILDEAGFRALLSGEDLHGAGGGMTAQGPAEAGAYLASLQAALGDDDPAAAQASTSAAIPRVTRGGRHGHAVPAEAGRVVRPRGLGHIVDGELASSAR